ncbi:MAG: RidA family protein [Deltaproteobacteria bacterium]
MLLLDIQHVGALSRPLGAPQRVAARASTLLDAAPGEARVFLRELSPEAYGETGPGRDAAPVLVRLTRLDLPVGAERAQTLVALGEAIAEELDRPVPSVHVILEPPAAGRVALGGEPGPPPPRHRVQTAARWESLVGYARAVRVGELVWVTGTTALDASGEPVGKGDAYAQAAQCIANLERALVALGSSRAGVVRTRMFVTDIARDWEAIGRAHAEAFGESRPATTMVEVRKLISDWMLVEIEADAVT